MWRPNVVTDPLYCLEEEADFKALVQADEEYVRQLVISSTMILTRRDPYDKLIIRLSIFLFVGITVVCTLGCYYFGRAHLGNLSAKTRVLYWQFITSLCIELSAAFAVWMVVFFFRRERHQNVGIYLMWRANFLYPTLIQEVLHLSYITCYRRAVLRLFGLNVKAERILVMDLTTTSRTDPKVHSFQDTMASGPS